jgi:hypothetical protein
MDLKLRIPKPLVVVGTLFALVVSLVLLRIFPPEEYSFYPKCTAYVLTGWKCPGCGTLRALHALSTGNPLQAWGYNPLLFIFLGAIPLLLLPEELKKHLRPHAPKLAWAAFAALAGFALLRNLQPASIFF